MLEGKRRTSIALSRLVLSPYGHYIVLAATIFLGTCLRAYHLGSKSLWLDEAVIYWITRGPLPETLRQNAVQNSAPPLFGILVSLLPGLGTSEAALRTVPFVAGVLCIPAAYFLGRVYLSDKGALLLALLVAIAPIQIQYSQQLREYSLSVLLCILMLFAVGIFFKRPSWGRAFLVALVVFLGAFTQYGLGFVAVAVIVAIFVFILHSPQRGRMLFLMWALVLSTFLITSAVVYRLSLAYQFTPGGFAGQGYLALGYWAAGTPLSAARFVYHGMRDLVEYAFPGSVFALVFFVGTLLLLVSRTSLSLLSLALLPFLSVAVGALLRLYPLLGARQDLFLTPIIYLLASMGLAYLFDIDKRRLVLLVLGLLLVRDAISPIAKFYNSDGMSSVGNLAETLSSSAAPNEPIYVCHAFDPVIRYYFQVRFAEIPNPIVQRLEGPAPRAYLDQADELISRSQRTWLLLDQTCGDIVPFVNHISQRWHLELVEERAFARLYLAY